MGFHTGQQRERAIFQFHHHALERFLGFLVRNFQQLKNDGLVFAQHFARGDTEQQGIADLTSGASNGHANGLFTHEKSPKLNKGIKPGWPDCQKIHKTYVL